MRLGNDVTHFDTLHMNGEYLALCSFRMRHDAPEFIAWKALDRHHVVLPRTAMYLLQEDKAPFVADPVMATFHNPGTAFRREPIAGNDDESDYLILDAAAVDEIAGELGIARRGEDDYRFPVGQSTLPHRVHATAMRLFARAAANPKPAALWLEEHGLAFAANCIAAAQAMPDAGDANAARKRVARWRPDPVARAKRYMIEHLGEAPSLAEIARGAHSSPFHLTRLFRARTGLSLHQYVMALKLRVSLNRLEAYDGRLDRLAQTLGFSDLPHLSRLFRKAFGMSPREFLRDRRHRVGDLDWH